MLRGRARAEILAALFLETGWRGDGRPERHAGVPAARGGRDTNAEQEAARGAFPARSCGWIEQRRPVRRSQLLPDAPDDCVSASVTSRGTGAPTPRTDVSPTR